MYLVFVLIVAADLGIKALVTHSLNGIHSMPIIKGVLYLSNIHNTGSAFGFFQGQRNALILIGIVICIVVLHLYMITEEKEVLARFSLILILGGSIGNLLNRIMLGYVIDYIDFRVLPVFNLADMAINAGVALLIFDLFFKGRKCTL